jgi:hypothetical protein
MLEYRASILYEAKIDAEEYPQLRIPRARFVQMQSTVHNDAVSKYKNARRDTRIITHVRSSHA